MHAAFPSQETSSSLPELYNKRGKGNQHLIWKGLVPLMHSSAQAWPLHLTTSCYLRIPPVNLIVLPLLALSVQKVCQTDEGRVSIVWSMKSNTKESNSVSAVKLLGLIGGLMLLAPCFPPKKTAEYIDSLLVCQREDDSCSGASSIMLEIKIVTQSEKKPSS